MLEMVRQADERERHGPGGVLHGGYAAPDHVMQLKEAGLTADNHNVDTSRSGVLAIPGVRSQAGERANNIY